jgi:hypothetical protein
MRLVLKAATVMCCGILSASATGVVAAEAVASRAVGAGRSAVAAAQDGGGRTFKATTETAAGNTTLTLTLDAAPGGGRLQLSAAEREQIADVLGVPVRELTSASPGGKASKGAAPAAKKGPATLRCDKNPSWTDARGTLNARFNCHHNTVNWGYKISAKARAIISGKVTEQGVSWWNNGKRKPKNAGHVVGDSYHFHGTLKPVKHRDHVQFQDYMTFRVNVGGKTGTGSLAWAANVTAKK